MASRARASSESLPPRPPRRTQDENVYDNKNTIDESPAKKQEEQDNKNSLIFKHWKGAFEGYLLVERKKLFGSSWKKYWTAIGKTGMLYVFKEPDSPRAWLAVDLASAFMRSESNAGTDEFSIYVGVPPKCVLRVRVASDNQKDEWVKALRESMGKLKADSSIQNGQVTRPRRNTE